MLVKLMKKTLCKSLFSRGIHIGQRLLLKESIKETFSEDPDSSESDVHHNKYVFREIHNESLIKDFCFSYFSPKLLKMPEALVPNDSLDKLIHQLKEIDLSNDERGREQLKKIGIFGAIIPRRYGGLGLTVTQYTYLLQQAKLIDWSLSLIAHQSLCAQTIVIYGSEEQKSHYLPRMATGELIGGFCLNETSSGNDLFGIESEGSFDLLENHYVLQGTKTWVINGHFADVFVAFLKTKDARFEGSRYHLSAFIIDRNHLGVSVGTPYNIDWLPNCGITDVIFDEAIVPVSCVLFEANAGYKIANYIQNNARLLVGAFMSNFMRQLLNDLEEKESEGKIPPNAYIDHLIEECQMYLFVTESVLYFTTRFADNYVHPEIELESAAVKVFTAETAVKVFEFYCQIFQLIHQSIPEKLQQLSRTLYGIQNFLGSNYFIKLYIGGTLVELSDNNPQQFFTKIRQPLKDIPWMKDSLKEKANAFGAPKHGTDSSLATSLKYAIFLDDIEKIYKELQIAKFNLVKFLETYRNETLNYQIIMSSMSNLGEIIYTLSCCIARANTTYDDHEIKYTERFLKRVYEIITENIESINNASYQAHLLYVINLAEEIKKANGYPCDDILEMRRELRVIPPKLVFKYDQI